MFDKSLESQALANVRDRRRRRKQSSIFDGSEKKTTQAKEVDSDDEFVIDPSQ